MEKKSGVIKRYTDQVIPYDFYNPSFNNLDKAAEVLEKLKVAIKLFGEVRVAYLYKLVDLDSDIEYDDTCYGWKDISDAGVHCGTSLFYICNLPEPMFLG